MINFLHTFSPNPILISLGPLHIYWYGMFIVLGILLAMSIAIKLASFYQVNKELIIDLAFYLIIGGVLGARIYDVLLNISYYSQNQLDIFKIWNGGLAIHGAIIAGCLIVYFYAKKKNINFWLLAALITPGLALAQAIGRWGNYFNQELYGLPTNLPWGIPIRLINRPIEYLSSNYFHPTFLYESIGNLIIFVVLLFMHYVIIKKQKLNFTDLFFTYLITYSFLRFSLETIRLDSTVVVWGMRWPQLISLAIIIFSISWLVWKKRSKTLAKK